MNTETTKIAIRSRCREIEAALDRLALVVPATLPPDYFEEDLKDTLLEDTGMPVDWEETIAAALQLPLREQMQLILENHWSVADGERFIRERLRHGR